MAGYTNRTVGGRTPAILGQSAAPIGSSPTRPGRTGHGGRTPVVGRPAPVPPAEPPGMTGHGGRTPAGSPGSPAPPPPPAPPPAGIQPGVQQPQIEGLDMTKRGPVEQAYVDHGKEFFDQTNSQSWWNLINPGLNQPGAGAAWNTQNAGALQNPNAGEGILAGAAGSLGGPSETATWVDANLGATAIPGMGEDYATGALGKYADGTPDVTNRSAEAYDDFLANRPDINPDAGLAAYYENAKRRGSESLNQQFGSRGAYGSSVALGQLSDLYGGLEAERANREADYYLRTLGEMRAWEGLGGNMAQSADLGSLRQSQNELGWTQGLGGLAFQGQDAERARWLQGLTGAGASDASTLARTGLLSDIGGRMSDAELRRMGLSGDFAFRAGDEDLRRAQLGISGAGAADAAELSSAMGGFTAAGMAQNAQRTRGQDYFTNELLFGDRMSGIMGSAYDDLINTDQQNWDMGMALGLGVGAEDLLQKQRKQAEDQSKEDAFRALVWGGGIAGAPFTSGLSLAAIPAYELYQYAQ